ncbi:BT_3987 domain-containing protein [Pedobacter xixiisoli]|uniref:Concanavalin A-like lectin/glucanases superfamily protein n=1 Tax=Pedobacter xixiisoli TaxID=1476464 RepID=A0A286A8I6_9SPHI|nr:DUF1735 domain-containing protein [Pedobacter xixiisoli]SOD18224.1 Concanavalin A-like lectin/glucanases superfamily protein [Pedobacter xixiisoli]
MKKKFNLKSSLYVVFSLLLITVGCKDFDYNKNVILVTGTDSNPVTRFVVENTPSSYTVTASTTDKVSQDVTVNFAVDNSLIEEYNRTHRTSYYAIPASAIQIDGSQGVIKAGSAASTGITVRVVSTADFIDGRTYVIPVTIKSIEGAKIDILEPSRTIFLRVSRVINFNSLNMNNTNLYSNFIFEDNKAVNLANYTYEIKCYVNAWHTSPEPISRLCSFTAKDESRSNMLRFGEIGQDINSLQWVSPGGSLISAKRFNPGQWYTISLTFDGKKYVMYVDGVKDAELIGTTPSTFQRFELGMSWENYPSRQYFNGRVAEARVWNRALTANELQLGICGVDPKSTGLVAYWKFNEGTGYIFKDATGNGYDMDWSKTVRDNTGNGTLNTFDKRAFVGWQFDGVNKCSQ